MERLSMAVFVFFLVMSVMAELYLIRYRKKAQPRNVLLVIEILSAPARPPTPP